MRAIGGALAPRASMFSPTLLLCFLLLQAWTIRASPDVPVSTQAIVTTITAPTVSNSLSTSQTVFESTSTFEDIQTITTTDTSGNTITTTTDNGPTSTVFEITSNVVLTIPITAYITFVSTLGQTTILGPDPTTSVSTDHDSNNFSSNLRQDPCSSEHDRRSHSLKPIRRQRFSCASRFHRDEYLHQPGRYIRAYHDEQRRCRINDHINLLADKQRVQ